MRIAIFEYLSAEAKRPSISISQTVAWLRRHGHTAQLIVPEYRSVFSSVLAKRGHAVSAFRLFSFGSFAIPLPVGSMVIRRVLDRLRPDVVHIHQPFFWEPSWNARRRVGGIFHSCILSHDVSCLCQGISVLRNSGCRSK